MTAVDHPVDIFVGIPMRGSTEIRDFWARVLPLYEGQLTEIIVRPWVEPKKRRTLRQNDYLHAEPFPKLARHWGESIARTKLICMGKFWGWEPCRVTGSVLPVKAHTSDMTVEECTTFIEWIVAWANEEHHADVRLPHEWERGQR